MFSHLMSAARGLFASSESSHQSDKLNKQAIAEPRAMVTTRRSILSQVEDSSPSRDTSPIVGKRKIVSSTTGLSIEPSPKRRRGQAKKDAEPTASTPQPNGAKKRPFKVLEAVEIISSGSNTRESSILTPTVHSEKAPQKSSAKSETAHVRFGSEEPEPDLKGEGETVRKEEEEEATTSGQENRDDNSSDDEAPEAISNTKQLRGIKEADRKREEARQQYGQEHYSQS